MLVCSAAVSQTNHNSPDQEPVGAAINIAVSNLDVGEGNVYFSEAERNERDGAYDEALNLFGKAAFEYNSAGQFSRYCSALMRLSNVHYLLTHYTEAEQVVLNVALKNYAKIGSRSGQMESYGQLGKIYLASNKLTQSLWFYTQQGIIARQIGSSYANIESVLGIANVKIKRKEYMMAAQDLNKAELLARSANTSAFKSQIRVARALIPSRKSKS